MSTRPNGVGVAWSLRKDLKDYVYPGPTCEGFVIWFGGQRIVTDRATARLLAKRINQCLDATVKK